MVDFMGVNRAPVKKFIWNKVQPKIHAHTIHGTNGIFLPTWMVDSLMVR